MNTEDMFLSSKFGIYHNRENNELIKEFKKECQVWNPQFLYLRKKEKYTGNTAEKLKYFKDAEDKSGRPLTLFPRNIISDIPNNANIKTFTTRGWGGFPELTPKFNLWPEQELAVSMFVEEIKKRKSGCGLLKGPCGSGKTIMCSAVIHRLGLRSLILVDQNMLGDQWVMALEDYLGLVEGQYVFRDKTKRCAKQMLTSLVDITTIQSLMPGRSPMTSEEKLKYGLVITDECHIIPAEVISKVVSSYCPAFNVGTTATDHRKDGRSKVIRFFVGDTLASVVVKQMDPVVRIHRIPQIVPDTKSIMDGIDHTVSKRDLFGIVRERILPHANHKDLIEGVRSFIGRCYEDITPSFIAALTDYIQQQLMLCSWWSTTDPKTGESIDGTVDMLCKNEFRNSTILNNVIKDYNDGRHQLILSPFIYHCEHLMEAVSENKIEARLLCGEVKRKDRISIIRDFKAEKFRTIIATFPLVKKGLDVPILDSLHMLHPFKILSPEEPGDLEQAIGRILRKKEKPLDPQAVVNAYFDKGGGPEALFWKHYKYYKLKGWNIQWFGNH